MIRDPSSPASARQVRGRRLNCGSSVNSKAKSLSENSVGVLFSRKRLEGKARQGRIPAAVSDRGATKPAGLFLENPPGGGSFVRGLRWLGRYSPLRGCSSLAALATAKIPRRRTPRNFQTGSKNKTPAEAGCRTTGRIERVCSPRRHRDHRDVSSGQETEFRRQETGDRSNS